MTRNSASRWVVLPPHVLLAAILLGLALDRWLPLVRLWGSPCGYVGTTVIVFGFLVNIYCGLQLRRHQTTVIPFRQSTTLLTEGLYRYTRNPIYTSMVLVLLGFAIAWGSLSPWFVPPLFAWIVAVRFIRSEEAMLLDTFGEEYRAYCRRVPRWLARARV